MKQVEQFKKLEQKKLPEDIDYEDVGSLRIEARQKLEATDRCPSARRPVSPVYPRLTFPCFLYIWKADPDTNTDNTKNNSNYSEGRHFGTFFCQIPRHIRQNAITEGDLECILTRNCEVLNSYK